MKRTLDNIDCTSLSYEVSSVFLSYNQEILRPAKH